MERRERLSAQRAAAEEARKAAQGEEDAEDEALQLQRALDDWKDEHPAGYGNSKLRPCAL